MANNDLKTEFMFEWSKHFGYGTMISVLKKRRVVKETMQINTFRFRCEYLLKLYQFLSIKLFLVKINEILV